MKRIIITEDQYRKLIGEDYMTPEEDEQHQHCYGTVEYTFSTPMENADKNGMFHFGKCLFSQDDYEIPPIFKNEYIINDTYVNNGKFYFTVEFKFDINCTNDVTEDNLPDVIMENEKYEILGVRLNDDMSFKYWNMIDSDVIKYDYENITDEYYEYNGK